MKLKIIIFGFLLTFVFLQFSSASLAGISPLKLEINLTDLNPRCEIVWIEFSGQVDIEIFWAKSFSENPLDYDLKSDQIGVLFSYKEVNPGEYNFCFQGTKKGQYYGVTRISSQKSLIALGNFVNLNIDGASRIQLLTGKAIQEIRENNYDLWFILLCLLLVLVFLVINIARKH